jgi:hypothetical protein
MSLPVSRQTVTFPQAVLAQRQDARREAEKALHTKTGAAWANQEVKDS